MTAVLPPFPSAPDSPGLAATYVRGFGVLGVFVAIVMGVGAAVVSRPVLVVWALLGAAFAAGAGLQLWRRKPDPGLLIAVASTGAVPAALVGSGGELPAVVATGSLVAVSTVLVESNRRRMVPRLAIIYLSVAGATLVHAHRMGGTGRLAEAIIGAVVLGVGFAVTYFLFNTSFRVAQYDQGVHQALFESSSDGVVVVDEHGVIARSNPAAEEIFGFEPGGMVGKPVSILLAPAFRERHEGRLSNFVGGKTRSRLMRDRPVLQALRTWGDTFPAEISVTTFDVGDRRMAAAMVRDVTRRVEAERKARERLALYRKLYERVPIALYRTTPAGRIEEGNTALLDLLGAESFDDLSQIDVESLFVDPSERQRVLAQMDPGPAEALFQMRTLDGRLLWVRDHGQAIRDETGEIIAYEGAVENVTEHVEAVAALETSTAEKQRLIAAVAHNLRTPLTVILGYADLLEQTAGSGEDVIESARLVREQAHELSALVDEVVLASRLDGHGETLSVVVGGRVGVDQAIDEALKSIGGIAGALEIGVAASGAVALGDSLRMQQTIRLVLSHVLRHGGRDVTIEACPRDDDTVRIAVHYVGTGVPEDEREYLFKPFSASQANSIQPGRLDVGLWAARRLARMMEGDLTYVEEDGRSRFELTLPA